MRSSFEVGDIVRTLCDEPLKEGISREELRSRLTRLAEKAYPFLLDRLTQAKKITAARDLVRLRTHKVSLRSDQEEVKGKVESYFRPLGDDNQY